MCKVVWSEQIPQYISLTAASWVPGASSRAIGKCGEREGGLGLREASVMSASAAASVKARSVFREFFRKARLFEDDNMRE